MEELERFKNKHRIVSNRLAYWDYSQTGAYFLTLVTQNRKCVLGTWSPPYKEAEAVVRLSEMGQIVAEEWQNSFEIRKELTLDEFIVMPNHLHAIVILENPESAQVVIPQNTGSWNIQSDAPEYFYRKPKSISSFIAIFKSTINSRIDDYIDTHGLDLPKYNRHHHFFQSDYYDRVIRSETEYQQIKRYIVNNPAAWLKDRLL